VVVGWHWAAHKIPITRAERVATRRAPTPVNDAVVALVGFVLAQYVGSDRATRRRL
jgi:hypothetical protein